MFQSGPQHIVHFNRLFTLSVFMLSGLHCIYLCLCLGISFYVCMNGTSIHNHCCRFERKCTLFYFYALMYYVDLDLKKNRKAQTNFDYIKLKGPGLKILLGGPRGTCYAKHPPSPAYRINKTTEITSGTHFIINSTDLFMPDQFFFKSDKS